MSKSLASINYWADHVLEDNNMARGSAAAVQQAGRSASKKGKKRALQDAVPDLAHESDEARDELTIALESLENLENNLVSAGRVGKSPTRVVYSYC